MNLYNLHKDPKSLYKYKLADMEMPEIFWGRYRSEPGHVELKKRERFIATSPMYSYRYADYTLNHRFPKGEAAIARSAKYSYLYAKDVIGGRFHEGEAAIAMDSSSAFKYARDIIKGRFPEGEAAIVRDSAYTEEYEKLTGIKL